MNSVGDIPAWLGIVAAVSGYLLAAWRVDRAHPRTPVPSWRVIAWLAGVSAIGLALGSLLNGNAETLLSVHMVQHLLLSMVAPPLLALAAPAILLLRVSRPGLRQGVLLPILHSRAVQALSWPPLGWALFAVVMWTTHFSPLFNAALEDPRLHVVEHGLYLFAGALFWWPVIGADPSRWRLNPLQRAVYLAGQMPVNTAVGLAIYFAPSVLYPHYRDLGPTSVLDPITDQQLAGILMWGVGDVIMLGAIVLVLAAWLRADERRSRRLEARAAASVERAPAHGR